MGNVTYLRTAFCLPGERINWRRSSFGVYDSKGTPAPHTEIRTASWVNVPVEKASPPQNALHLFGPALFAGSADKQFGFVLLNALGRLWALEDLPPQTTIVYGAKPTRRAIAYAFLPVVLRSLGLHNPVAVLKSEARFEELHLREERFGEARGGRGTPEFYDWIDRRWACAGKVTPGRKLYVTRSALGPMEGRYACETHLETLLAEEGYEIFAPEQHPLEHQIDTFARAERLIFAEGSALHLFALIRQPEQISAVVQRRPELPAVMTAQMCDRAGPGTLAINTVTELLWPPVRGDHKSRAVLDFDSLRADLRAAGLISGRGWRVPRPEEVTASLNAGLSRGDMLMDRDQHKAWQQARRA